MKIKGLCVDELTLRNFPAFVDHTLLKSTATEKDIETLCREAMTHRFFAVCVNPLHVFQATRLLHGSAVQVATVCDFPLGSSSLKSALAECENSLEDGASEVDMVISVGALKEARHSLIETQISSLKKACGPKILKVILEICLLTPEEIITACNISKASGADFVKTSTGFSTGGATEEAVSLMRKTVGKEMGVKASGGIRNLEQAQAMVKAGANRLGLSSSLKIMEELKHAGH